MTDRLKPRRYEKVRFERLEARRLMSSTPVQFVPAGAEVSQIVSVDSAQNQLGELGVWVMGVDGCEFVPASELASQSGGMTLSVDTDGNFVFTPGGFFGLPGGVSTPTISPTPIAAPAPATRLTDDMEMTIGTVVQADGKVITATLLGAADNRARATSQTFDRITLARFNADGSVDTTFGTDGSTTYTLGESITSDYWPGAAVADSEGRILVAHYGAIMRFNADGSIDSTFGTDGTVNIDATDMLKVLADGKIGVLADDKLSRLNEDGSLDTTFTPYSLSVEGSRWRNAQLHDFSFAADGSVYVVGEIRTANDGMDVAMTTAFITKLDSTGVVDMTFANNGRYELGQSDRKWESFDGVQVLADGTVQVIGHYSFLEPFANPNDPSDLYMDGSGLLLARFNPDGSLDTTFGDAGMVNDRTMALHDLEGMTILNDGRIVASTYGMDGAKILVANADGSGRRFLTQRVDLAPIPPGTEGYFGSFETTTRAPTIAPDGTIVTGVSMADLNSKSYRIAAKAYWTRFDLNDLPAEPEVTITAPETTTVDAPAEVDTPAADSQAAAPDLSVPKPDVTTADVPAATDESAVKPSVTSQASLLFVPASTRVAAINRSIGDLFDRNDRDLFGDIVIPIA